MRRTLPLLCLLLALALLLPLYTAAAPLPLASTSPPASSARAMALLDVDSGQLLASKNEGERLPMASTTKIMTALLAIEHLPLDREITVPREATGIEGSSIYLFAGERITVETLLYALLLSSANDAAVALALAVSDSVADFAALMNEKARELGLSNTHFCNPNGLHDPAHYTTAYELAILTAVALKNPVFAQIVRTQRHTAAQKDTEATRLFLNHNRLLRTYKGAIGVKTGFTRAAGRCLVSAAEREELRLVCVTLSCPDDWRDHTALLDWGFSAYGRYTPALPALTLPVVGGESGQVALRPAKALSLTLPRDAMERMECEIELPRFLFGGFEQGKQVGRLVYRLNGVEIAQIPLLTANACAGERPLGLWARIKSFFQNIG